MENRFKGMNDKELMSVQGGSVNPAMSAAFGPMIGTILTKSGLIAYIATKIKK